MPNWTDDQIKVIDTRDNNILVSAAAGSGKTAVLVERIINKIIKDKTEVDRLLVVTFTKAAAKEMSERIRNAINAEIEKDPANEFLIRQKTLVANADICTIDSFCGKLVRENFNDIGIDPSFRICDPGEEKLLLQEAINSVIDRRFEEDREVFRELMMTYTEPNNESGIIDILTSLYYKSGAYPWPREWLEYIAMPYMLEDVESINDLPWVNTMYNDFLELSLTLREELQDLLDFMNPYFLYDKRGKNLLEKSIVERLDTLEELDNINDIYGIFKVINNLKSMSKFTTADIDKRLDTNLIRTYLSENNLDSTDGAVDTYANRLVSRYNLVDANIVALVNKAPRDADELDILDECKTISRYVMEILDIESEIIDTFTKLKNQQNIASFSDVERYALDILINTETKELTGTALDIREKYDEVMIDEYQDSNDLQEAILSSVAKDNNMFMVGDVKQSIYGFRMAKPKIFVDKFDLFSEDNSKGEPITLKENFRSRHEVLDFVNDVFSTVMSKSTCGVEYDDNAALHYGATQIYSVENDVTPEVLVIDKNIQKEARANGEGFDEAGELEATVIAEKILELMDTQKVTTKGDNPTLRPLQYSDIAILLRSASGKGPIYERVLLEHNIPCHFESGKGYFDSVEVGIILSFLAVLDNPRQDVELTAVLHSKIFNISNDILARVRISDSSSCLYEAIKQFLVDNVDDNSLVGLRYAYDLINELRQLVPDTPIHEIIELIYNRTGYLDYVSALTAGDYRRANLLELINQAIKYEETSFRGLFHFMNYIESLQEYNVDLKGASLSNENDNVVRILTMHKSKGLEFPVCFVSQLADKLESKDLKNSTYIHNEYGIGMDSIVELGNNRKKVTTRYKSFIGDQIKRETMGEEARILYVALTRAREKLIVTAALDKPEEFIDGCTSAKMNKTRMTASKSYIEWIIRALNTADGKNIDRFVKIIKNCDSFESNVISYQQIMDKKAALQDYMEAYNQELYDYIDDRINYDYADKYVIDNSVKSKYSVSEIKHNAMEEAFEEYDVISENESVYEPPEFLEEKKESIVPFFISNKEETTVNGGALYGTAMHRYMECYDFVDEDYTTTINAQLDTMVAANLITGEQASKLNITALQKFIDSDVAFRMHDAAINDRLWIEQPFVIGEEPTNILPGKSSELDSVIVQGIIDAFWEEEDGMVLLDYKTDSIENGDELIKRYKAQIDLYAKAIERFTGKPVIEKILYSFKLNQVVSID